MRNEIQAIAELGEQEGALSKDESAFIKSLLQFKDIRVDAVMTPNSVVASLNEAETVDHILSQDIPFSRIPPVCRQPKQNNGLRVEG